MDFEVKIGRIEHWLSRTKKIDDCLHYQGALRDGYAITFVNGRSQNIHRVIYQNVYGSIPATNLNDERLVLDHLCRNRSCLNIRHLELVTNHVNILRGVNANKTHCKHGHLYDKENTGINVVSGNRYCRICYLAYKRMWQKKYIMRKKNAIRM